MRLLPIGSLLVAGILFGCISPEEQRAQDQQTCAGYGFTPGTDAFAHCMMHTADKRDAIALAKQQMQANYRQLSLQRSGDTRFPVCGAASPNTSLDVTTNTWYGSDCRSR